jgi:spermidine synthase
VATSSDPAADAQQHEGRPLHPWLAGTLVFGSSAAVLVVEIVALRLLAPYLGLTLETSTLVIGIALAAIAFGSWSGGRAADVVSPRATLGPLLAVSGAVVAVTPFVVRAAGQAATTGPVLLLATATVFVAGAALSAVTPMVTKLQLTSLGETGAVVGRLSGVGTVGAILGTVVTGFVLISRVPVSGILVGLGIALVVSAMGLEVALRRRRPGLTSAAVVLLGGLTAAFAPGGCDEETVYHCAEIVSDEERDGGRLLLLDGVGHSYVDLDDPTHLEFRYVQAAASVVDTAFPEGEALTTYHLGAGGLTVPRYLDVVRPGSTSLVSEIDPEVVAIDEERLGLETGDSLEVRVEDGRLGLGRLPDATYDLVVGDAFGGVSVPWHLTTREALTDVRRVVAGDGVYVMNLIDHGDLGFARAAVATLQETFDHVVLAAAPDTLARDGGGNLVVAASDRPVDAAAWEARIEERGTGWETLESSGLSTWVGDARVLTDDYAPVDQLLTPYPAR